MIHPRVTATEADQERKCPYCGIVRKLADYGGENDECDRCALAARHAQWVSSKK